MPGRSKESRLRHYGESAEESPHSGAKGGGAGNSSRGYLRYAPDFTKND